MVSKLKLQVDVDVSGSEKLNTLGGKFQTAGANLSKFVTLPLLGAGVAALKLAGDAQKADAKLANVFESMGASAFTSLDALNEQAGALAKLSSFDDEGIKQAQAVMLTFGNVTGKTFEESIGVVTDMSELLGQDLQSSAIQVGKALNDPVKGITALQRVGVSFTEEQKEQIATMVEMGDTAGAQALILQELQREFGGTAEAIANTDAGQAAQAFEDLGEAGESIGTILLPALGSLARFVSSLAQGFAHLDPGMQQFVVVVGGVVAAIGPLVFVGGKLISSFKAVGAAFSALKLLFLANPWVALAAAVIAIAALIILNWDKIWGFLKGIWDKITGAVKVVADAIGKAWEALGEITEGIWEGIANVIKGSINAVIDVVNAFLGFLNGISFGAGPWDVGPIHIDAISIDPFNIPLIPHLAEGGIVDGATLALIGERGPEAVIPLDRAGDLGRHFHSHIEVRGEEPFIRNTDDLVRVQQRVAFLEGF